MYFTIFDFFWQQICGYKVLHLQRAVFGKL